MDPSVGTGTTRPDLRVLIVGASIAGPMAAYYLSKAGASVTVIERYPHTRTNGHNVDIRTSAVTVMRRTPGMEAAVRSKLAEIEGICLVDADGRPYGTIKATGNPDQQSLLSEYEIYRGELSQVIIDLTKDDPNIKYVYDEQIMSIQQDATLDGPVKVEFMNHLPMAEYDLVVACDGATSRTRAIGFECGVRDHIKSTNCWTALFSIPADLLDGSKVGHGNSSVPGRFMALDHNPSGGNFVQMVALNPKFGQGSNDDATAPLRAAMKEGTTALKRYVADYFRGHGWKSEQVLQHLLSDSVDDLYTSEFVQVRVPSLYKGRFVLVGDAGYAPGFTGTGTTLAITGAYVLGGEICRSSSESIKAGLEGYERTMRPLITEMSKVPPLVPTVMAPQTAWGLWLRNFAFSWIAWSSGLFAYAQRLLGSAGGKVSNYPLPEYEWVR